MCQLWIDGKLAFMTLKTFSSSLLNVSLHFLYHLIIISPSTAKSLRAFIFYDVVSDYDEPFVSISMKAPNTNNDHDNVNHTANDLKLSIRHRSFKFNQITAI